MALIGRKHGPVRFDAMAPVQPFDGPVLDSGGEAPPSSQVTGPRIPGTPVEISSSSRAPVARRVVRTSRRTLSSETPVELMRTAEQGQRLLVRPPHRRRGMRRRPSPSEHHRIAGRVVMYGVQ